MGSPGTLSNIMGRVLTIQIVHRNPRSKPRSQLVARRKCTFGESIQRPYISNFNRAPIMILTRAPAAVAVAAMGMLVFSITGKSKSKSDMVANVSMSHMECLTQSKYVTSWFNFTLLQARQIPLPYEAMHREREREMGPITRARLLRTEGRRHL
jgi:hypothetical protein